MALQAAGLGEELGARDRLRVVGEALRLGPLGRNAVPISWEPSVSSAVAPLYVSTAIEMIVRTAATIATGRRDGRRSRRRSKNGSPMRRISRIVGMPTVAMNTVSGHSKIRRR